MNERTWSIYCNMPAMLADCLDEGNEPVGANGSNWHYGYTASEASEFIAKHIKMGWSRGHNHAPRF